MKKNEGSIDRVVRVVVGLAVLSQAFWGAQTPWAYLGLVPLITGAIGFCPVYSLFGITSCPFQGAEPKR